MSYAIARQRLVSIVEAVTPAATARGYPATFKHEPEASDTNLPGGARGFFLRADEGTPGGVHGPYTPDLSGQPRLVVPMTLVVAYEAGYGGDAAGADVAIEEDRRSISAALLIPSSWGSSTDGICWIDGGEKLLAGKREILESGTILLTFSFDLVYR